ncbi:uncharacterized protein PRCAT00004120001 [Priceomyces carsonii]|uniref:uncharacterized protein n=1 Tax=Priceomyces carsonii TaxID=28549 RepID=UPI002EDB4F2C|nr:unnamed protein product [Priceomyces carsonii]
MSKSQILTDRQQSELNKAIVQYIEPYLTAESNDGALINHISNVLDVNYESKDNNIIPNYLEKKWSTVLRLQKKIIDLENEITNLKTVLDNDQVLKINVGSGRDKVNWIPSVVGKTILTKAPQLVQAVSLHPSLPIIACGCADGSLIIWSITNDESAIPDKILNAHTRNVNRLEWSHKPISLSAKDSSKRDYVLASCSSDLSIKIWDASTYLNVRTLTGHEHTVSSIAFSRTKPNILYSVSRDKMVKIWDLIEGFCIRSFIGHSDWVRDLDVASINSLILLNTMKKSNELGDFLITCSNDQSIRLSHAETGTGLAMLIGHSHVIERVKFLPLHSNYIIDKYLEENIKLFPTIPEDLITNTIYEEDLGYKYCISAARDNLIKLWLLPPPALRANRAPLPSGINNSQGWLIADLVGHQSWVKALAIHPNGRIIFSAGDDKVIKVWDLESLNSNGSVRCISSLSGHDGFINDLDFAKFDMVDLEPPKYDEVPFNKKKYYEELMKIIEKKMKCLLVSGAVDCTVKLWN